MFSTLTAIFVFLDFFSSTLASQFLFPGRRFSSLSDVSDDMVTLERKKMVCRLFYDLISLNCSSTFS